MNKSAINLVQNVGPCGEENDEMKEAEVTLRLAFFLINNGIAKEDIAVCIDGMQVESRGCAIFALKEFLADEGWYPAASSAGWQGTYMKADVNQRIVIKHAPGPDVSTLTSRGRLRAECKGGPLQRSKTGKEYRLLHEALGQLLSLSSIRAGDILLAAVPASERNSVLADRLRNAPLMGRTGIQIVTVSRSGEVYGLDA